MCEVFTMLKSLVFFYNMTASLFKIVGCMAVPEARSHTHTHTHT